jgi:two-component system, LytTR family, response regulator
MTLMTMKAILEKLPADKFKRIHRSYIISLPKIKTIVNKKVKLQTTELPISDSYSVVIKEWVNK